MSHTHSPSKLEDAVLFFYSVSYMPSAPYHAIFAIGPLGANLTANFLNSSINKMPTANGIGNIQNLMGTDAVPNRLCNPGTSVTKMAMATLATGPAKSHQLCLGPLWNIDNRLFLTELRLAIWRMTSVTK